MTVRDKIENGQVYLGIELGSTRIKAVLTDDTAAPVAGGSHSWENRYENGVWTYSEKDIHDGIAAAYRDLKRDVSEKYGVKLKKLSAMGISAMMHGYLSFDEDDRLLVPFRTWRNTSTAEAAEKLTALFDFNIPQRWSIAHLYQAILNKEPHIPEISHLNTLAGYIHFLLTGKRVLGVGDASGMFPIAHGDYDSSMMEKFDLAAKEHGFTQPLSTLLPAVLKAGDEGGILTESGAKLLDPEGDLLPGVPLCPPEGDAGTGMTATNAVLPRTGNVSAGTSVFSMLVLEKPLSSVYTEIDMVTTPDGAPVAMVHCNNCCSELDTWINLFDEFVGLTGGKQSKSDLYDILYKNALKGEADCGGVISYNFLSGEPVAGVDSGRPMYFRTPDSRMSLANFFRSQLYSSFGALRNGMDILFKKENASADNFTGHGGIFKTEGVAQQFLADALDTPVSVMKTAGEGGAWGMALLAAFMVLKNGKSLPEWLDTVFSSMEKTTLSPDPDGVKGFAGYMELYNKGLEAERKLNDVDYNG